MLLGAALGWAALAGRGVDGVLGAIKRPGVKRRARLAAVGFIALVGGLALGSLATANGPTAVLRASSLGAAALAGAAGLWALVSLRGGWSRKVLVAGWLLLAGLDLVWMNRSLLEVRPWDAALGQGRALALSLHLDAKKERAFSPSYSLPQHAAALAGLELAEGVNPLQLEAYWEYMAPAVGFAPDGGYSVTLPPFAEGDPSLDWGVAPDAPSLGLLNVKLMVSAYPVEAPGWALRERGPDVWTYENEAWRPRAWVEDPDLEKADAWRRVDHVDWTPNRIQVLVRGPGLLVLSEVAYPGWQARLDGQEVEIQVVEGLLRAVSLPPGTHEVEFAFQPWSVFGGAALTLISFVGLAALWWRR
jgi:hypothetical protein